MADKLTLDDFDRDFFKDAPAAVSTEPKNLDELDAQLDKQVAAPRKESKPLGADKPRVSAKDFEGSTLQVGPLDTKIPIPASVGMGLAQIGSGMSDAKLAYDQIFGKATKADADAKRLADAPLTEGSIPGKINQFVGKVAPFMAIPTGWGAGLGKGAGAVLEGLTTGAFQGAMEPVGTGESRGANMSIGAAGGAMVPTVAAGLRTSGKATQDLGALARSAEAEGIPLGLADTSKSKVVKAFKSLASDLPLTQGTNDAAKEAQQKAFNKAVAKRFGGTEDAFTPAMMENNKTRIGGELNRLWNNNTVPYDAKMFKTMRDVEARLDQMPAHDATRIRAFITDFENQIVPDAKGNLVIPGEFANNFQSMLRKNAPNEGVAKDVMHEMRQGIIQNFNQHIGPTDAKALTQARSQYGALKTVEPAVLKGQLGMAGRGLNDIRPSDLAGEVIKGYGNRGATSPFGDLPAIGSHFLTDRVAQTGGSLRAMQQNALMLGPLSALGGSMYPINKALMSPGLRKALETPQVTRPLLGAPSAVEATREMIRGATQRLPAAGALAATGSLLSGNPAPLEEEGF